MQPDLANIYIEKILEEVTELTKNRLILRAQLAWMEKVNATLAAEVEALTERLRKASARGSKKAAAELPDDGSGF